MTIFDKIIEIYKRYENSNLTLCHHCLGRMFALLGTQTSNLERGVSLLLSITMENHRIYLSKETEFKNTAIKDLKILAENANFLPAQKVLENEGLTSTISQFDKTCELCGNIFLNLQKYIEKAILTVKDKEFNNFLVGTSPDSKIINKEDKFKSELNLLDSESFKSHFNREIGKILSTSLNKLVEFNNPDIVLIFSIGEYGHKRFDVDLIIKSVFISGRYNKLIRGIPQTHWFCKKCSGKGCKNCNFTGRIYEISIEQLISPEFVKEVQATESKFHGAGREDIDVRMLGEGRPFILELKNPKKRILDLDRIKKQVNKNNRGKAKISNLKYSSKKEVIKIKSESEYTKKIYLALVKTEAKVTKKEFKVFLEKLKNQFEQQKISQRTPNRVSHRRSDLIRKKKIYKIDGKYVKSNLFEFKIETQGGTYIKELINGDNGRTTPSFSSIFGFPTKCKELDVLAIKN